MSGMVGKMSVQAKIAELESRIVALEEKRTVVSATTTRIVSAQPFGEHWHKMWEEFHLMMKEVFKP